MAWRTLAPLTHFRVVLNESFTVVLCRTVVEQEIDAYRESFFVQTKFGNMPGPVEINHGSEVDFPQVGPIRSGNAVDTLSQDLACEVYPLEVESWCRIFSCC